MKKRAVGVSVAIALVMALAPPMSGWAQSAGDVSVTATGIEVEYHYADDGSLPQIPETFVYEGSRYELDHIGEASSDAAHVAPRQSYSDEITMDILPDAINSLAAYFPATVTVDDGEYKGEIGLIGYDRLPIRERFTGQVDRVQVFEGLPDNDAMRIPVSYDFEVRSDAEMGATQTATLALIGLDYEVSAYNELGRAVSFRATASYRGQESWLELHHYEVTAHYGGEVASTVAGLVVVATYRAPAGPVVGPAVVVDEPEPPQAAPKPLLPAFVIVLAVALSLALFGLLLWLLLLRKNARLVRCESGNELTVVRRHIKCAGGEALFLVPENVELFDGAKWEIKLNGKISAEAGEVVVIWREAEVCRADIGAVITLPQSISDEFLASATVRGAVSHA
jgi:hypothetical protein